MPGSTTASRASGRTRKRSQKATPTDSLDSADHQAAPAPASATDAPPTTTTTTASSARKPRATAKRAGARAAKNGGGGGNLTDASSAKASSVDLAGFDDALSRDVKPSLTTTTGGGSHYEGSEGPVDVNAPGYLAPDYTLNPAGPASSADIDFKCPKCDKTYRGKHARSIWRRHLQDKHGIPLAAQPRRTRWDNDANRPKSEEEKRTRTLESKRRWARKNRAEKGSVTGSARKTRDDTRPPTPSVAGSVGTPASDRDDFDDDDDDNVQDHHHHHGGGGGGFVTAANLLPLPPPPNGGFVDDEEGDSSFDAGSVGGWSAEGPPGLARGGSAPLGYPPSLPLPTRHHAQQQQQHPYASASNPFYPQPPNLYGYHPVGRRTPTKPSGSGPPPTSDPYLAAIAAAATSSRAGALPPLPGTGGGGGGGGGGGEVRRSSRRSAASSTNRRRASMAAAAADEDDDGLEDPNDGEDDLPRLPQLSYHPAPPHQHHPSNPYSQPFHSLAQDQPHGPPYHHHHQQQQYYLQHDAAAGLGSGSTRPLSPMLLSAAAVSSSSTAGGSASAAGLSGGYGYPPSSALATRPHSNPRSPVFPSPYDMPRASAVPVSPGAPAPVAMPYYARRQSPARVITTSGIAAGIPAPSLGSNAHAAAVREQGGLESPVKLRRTGVKGKEAIHRSTTASTTNDTAAVVNGQGGAAGTAPGGGGGGAGLGPHREDAAGILLALKAGPSSPMTAAAHVQSPVSSVRGSAGPAATSSAAPLGRGRRIPRGAAAIASRRKGKGVPGRDGGAEDDRGDHHEHDDDEEEEQDDEDEDHGHAVPSLMFRPNGPLSPWRAAMHGSTSTAASSSMQHHRLATTMTPTAAGVGAGAGAGAAQTISPRKRGRSTSPAPPPTPMLASTSSGEGGSTAAAHALLATAKKAHHQYAHAAGGPGSASASGSGPSWRTEASLVATPTPGNLMRMIESSPVVRFGHGNGGGGSAHLGHDPDDDDEEDDDHDHDDDDAATAAGDLLTSEGDMMRPVTEAEEIDTGGGRERLRPGHDSFSSSSGGGRRARNRASLESHRRHGAGGGSSSSGTGGAGAGSSSAARPLHHHHPAGLTSELGEFDIQPSSSSSGGGGGGGRSGSGGGRSHLSQQQQHHHHDPLRELDATMMHDPSSTSSSSVGVGAGASQAHLVTPAPAGTATMRRTVSANGPPPPRQVPVHPHDPFLAAGLLTESILPLSGAALSSLARGTAEPQSFVFSSPRHPVFSEKLGLTATPGPGVLYTRAGGGETPARGGRATNNGTDDASEAGGRIRELSGSNTSGDDDAAAKALKTPVMGRVFAPSLEGDGRRGPPAHHPTSSVGMPASDIDSMGGEDESETTGTAGTGRESQSPGKATVDDDYEDDDGYSEA
ncbi:hypothetical protein JCM3774_000874 [Rhodotorula dairenensis]